jgi:acetylglutamate kinase
MVLAGSINKSIVRAINAAGGKAVGLAGSDANLITAVKATKTKRDPDSNIERVVDLGFVGEPDRVDPSVLNALARQAEDDFIPVVAPVGVGPEGQSFNINADTAAGAVAGALKAKRVLIADGTAKGGMIPKLETAIQAVEKGVEAAVILDGRKPHALLMELFTEHGAGTLVC